MNLVFVLARVNTGNILTDILVAALTGGLLALIVAPFIAHRKKNAKKEQDAFRQQTGLGPRIVYVITKVEPMLDGERIYLTYGSGKRRILDLSSIRDRFPNITTHQILEAKITSGNLLLSDSTLLTAEYLFSCTEPASPMQK